MEVVITPQASRWAVFWTLVALATAIFTGHNIDQYVSGEAKLIASAITAMATIVVIMTYTIKGYHKADVEAGKQALAQMQVMANDMEILKQATIVAKKLIQEAQNKLKEVGAERQTLANEVELLRKEKQKRIEDLVKAKDALAKANDLIEKANEQEAKAKDALAKANEQEAEAIEKAKVDAKKEHLPYIQAGENYLLYSVCKGISRPNSSFAQKDRAKAETHFKELKISLDEFKDKYKSVAEKTILG